MIATHAFARPYSGKATRSSSQGDGFSPQGDGFRPKVTVSQSKVTLRGAKVTVLALLPLYRVRCVNTIQV
jgi:hypothetical protein